MITFCSSDQISACNQKVSYSCLKPGRVVQVIWIIWFTRCDPVYKYLDLTRILYWITCVIVLSGPNQSNELRVLDNGGRSISPNSFQDIWMD